MESTSSLSTMARRLYENADKIDAFATAHKLQSIPTAGNVPTEIQTARREILELAQEIQVLSYGPSDFLSSHQVHYQTFSCLRWLLRFDIFNHIPANLTPISYVSLATAASVPLERLRSIARMAMTSGLFRELEPGHIAHSQLSLAFSKDTALRDWARFITEYGQPSAAAFVDATQKWGNTVAKNETAYNVAFNTGLPFFEDIEQRPGLADEFARYMRSQARSDGLRHEHLLYGFDWMAQFGDRAHIVDVGGSSGFVAAALAQAYPGFTFTVQDLPEAVNLGPTTLAALPEDITRRIKFVAHDFFQPQPPQMLEDDGTAVGAAARGHRPDAYLLRKILHDWPAARAREILSNLAGALYEGGKATARVIVMDTILPTPGAIKRTQEAELRVRDLVMAQCFNSGERELNVWNELFASTTPRMKLLNWNQPSGSVMAIMEVGLEE